MAWDGPVGEGPGMQRRKALGIERLTARGWRGRYDCKTNFSLCKQDVLGMEMEGGGGCTVYRADEGTGYREGRTRLLWSVSFQIVHHSSVPWCKPWWIKDLG
jgi:hypothetical protein